MLAEKTFAQGAPAQVDRRMSTGIAAVQEAGTQDREYVSLPRDTQIDFTGPNAVPFDEVRPNTAVQFVLDRDVMLGGNPVLRAGIPTAGVAARVLRASRRRHRDGQMEIGVTKMVSGRAVELLLTVFNPEDHYAEYPDNRRDVHPGQIALPVVILLIVLAGLFGGDR
jgi:hypothetical protein